MSRKKNRKRATTRVTRDSLPPDIVERLLVVWRRLGHRIEWCDTPESWIKMFHSEPRPFRLTFYWEAVADMIADYMLEHPEAPPEDVLTDCLVATQYSASAEDPERLAAFREMWDEILYSSRQEIEAFIQADLDLAVQEETMEEVARLYASDYQRRE